MSTQVDRNTILDALEDDYRHDLAIHLYSSYLLHSINPLFPKKNWASWPLPVSEVPDPRTTTLYVDSIEFVNQLPVDINAEQLMFTPRRSIDTQTLSVQKLSETQEIISSDEDEELVVDEEEEEEEEEEEISELLEDDDKNNTRNIDSRQIMKIKTVSFQESLSNSKADLMNELMSLVERTIYKRLSSKNRDDISISECTKNLTMYLSKKLASRINTLFDNILETQKVSAPKKSATRPFLRLLNWQDVLMACTNDFSNTGDKLSTYNKVYDKCQYLFGGSKYNYDYDDDNDNENENEYEYDDNIDDSSATVEINPNRKKRAFNEIEYLDEVEKLNSSSAIYKDFTIKLTNRKAEIKHLEELKEKIFHRKLELFSKTNELTWNSTNHKKLTNRKRFPINTQNKELAKELALNHGGMNLDEDEYIIN